MKTTEITTWVIKSSLFKCKKVFIREKKYFSMALNIINLFTICRYYFTVSSPKLEQEETKEESKMCGGKSSIFKI